MVRESVVSVLLVGALSAGALAQNTAGVTYEIVAETGDAAFSSETFVQFMPPALNELRSVVFNAQHTLSTGDDWGI